MRWTWPRSVALAAFGQLAVGCGCTKSTSSPPPSEASPTLSASAARGSQPPPGLAPSVSAGAPLGAPGTWVEAVRLERWDDAARLIDALPATEREAGELRYVRARAAIALGDNRRAAGLLDGLESQLPVLRDDICRHRAAAQLEVGPYEAAAKYFAAHPDPIDQGRAALAFERAGQEKMAKAAADAAIRTAEQKKRPAEEQVLARAVRARHAEKHRQTTLAAVDLRWLATQVPTDPHAEGADARLRAIAPALALTKAERLARAKAFGNQGWIERTDAELEQVASAPGKAVRAGDVTHARAWALYVARSDYGRAADLFDQAAEQGSSDVVGDAFYAARSRSRANQDELAIQQYQRLVRRYPRSGYAERARYLGARLSYIAGKWDDAVRGYTDYLDRHGKNGQFRKTAQYERAVAWTIAEKWDRAAEAFEKLARSEAQSLRLASYRQLYAVAMAGAGKKSAAAQTFRKVIRDFPLSFPALASAARLAQLGEAPPSPIEPAISEPPLPTLEVRVPPKVRLFVRLGLERDAEEELHAHEAMIRSAYGVRGHEAVCRAYSELAIAARRFRACSNSNPWGALQRAPSARTRWVWDCMYPRPYEPLVRAAEARNQLPPNLLYAVMRQESSFRPAVVSPARAVGLMQLIPPTAQKVSSELGIEHTPERLTSPPHNIQLGAYYLAKLLRTFGGSAALAVGAYNAGPVAMSRWLESGETLPLDLFVARIPYSETRTYVRRVLGNLARYQYLTSPDGAIPTLSLELPKGARAGEDAF